MGEDPKENHEEEDEESLVRERRDAEKPSSFLQHVENAIQTAKDSVPPGAVCTENKFDGEILVIDDVRIHVEIIRHLLEELLEIGLGIKKESVSIHGSTKREEALEIAKTVENKLLLISDVYNKKNPGAMCLRDFIGDLQAFKKKIYTVLITGKVSKALQEMPELDPSTGNIVKKIIDKYGSSLGGDLSVVLNDFVKGDWHADLSKSEAVTKKTLPEEGKEAKKEVGANEEKIIPGCTGIESSHEDGQNPFVVDGRIKRLPPAEHSWVEAEEHLPAERVERIIAKMCRITENLELYNNQLDLDSKEGDTKNLRSLIVSAEEEFLRRDAELKELGGDSDEETKRILSIYDPTRDSGWHEKAFGNVESRQMCSALQVAQERFDLPVHKLVINDRGVGTGRSIAMLNRLIRDGYKNDEFTFEARGNNLARLAAQNHYGIDLMEKNIRLSQQFLSSLGVPNRNLIVGNFQDPLGEYRGFENLFGKKVHIDICWMRTFPYNTTTKKHENFLKQCAFDLIDPPDDKTPGGMLLIDTVVMRRMDPEYLYGNEAQLQLDDLKNLYPQLWLKYCREHHYLMPHGIDLLRMPRWPIRDNTTGKGFYNREITSMDYIQHILDINKGTIDLRIAGNEISFSEFVDKTEATKLGRKWIIDNDLDEYYRRTIQYRIDNGIIDPEKILEGESAGSENPIEALLDYVAFHMVKGFGAEYIILERPSKAQKEKDTRRLSSKPPLPLEEQFPS